eukprot:CAMPEP_0115523752 /NCGR_PEP_ID=MMETSP0271-20121206/80800_1 /TAXON_ID=71861 /ORGANISM="Scrippsiella trochoidea, Strain CCMP3099" /LENGTH=77 /DNA_ID=CAMNT_0002955177 /DNA_START=58 /DNA_END=288 /DNA_ORIENTATION=+
MAPGFHLPLRRDGKLHGTAATTATASKARTAWPLPKSLLPMASHTGNVAAACCCPSGGAPPSTCWCRCTTLQPWPWF